MPLVVVAVLVSLLGHAAGAAGGGWWLAATVAVGACVVGRVRAAGVLVALACVGLAGAGRAAAARWRDAACTAAMLERARTDSLVVVPDVDAAAGDRVPGRARLPWCELGVGIRAKGTLVGGAAYRVALTPRMGTRRPIVDLRATPAAAARTSALARWRAAAARRITARFGPDAPLVNALVVADVHDLDDAIRTRWARAGIVHALSVSGLHVGIVAGVLALVAQAAGARPGRAAAISFAGVGAYVLVIGACAPAVRSAIMFGAVAAARARQRPISPWAALALGAWVPVLVDPAVPLDLGWQLSVGGIAALEGAGALCRVLGLEGEAWHRKLRRELVTGVVASVASAPLVAWHMGLVSLVAPVANIVAAPLFSLAQPTLFLALLLDPVEPLARLVASAAVPLLRGLDLVAHVGAAPSWSAVVVAPTLATCVLGGVAVVAALAAVVRRTAGPPAVVAGGALVAMLWLPMLPIGRPGVLELHMLDVGQGDALALRTPAGRWVLIDAGPGPPVAPDAGRRTILPYVRRMGGEVVALVLTHADLDHVGGAATLLATLAPPALVEPGFLAGSDEYRAILDTARVHGVAWRPARAGLALDLDGVRLRVLAPDSAWTAEQSGPNDASTILRVEYGDIAILLVGDAERAQEARLLDGLPPDALRADVLKVGHHGSRTSSTAPFLDAVAPSVALISVGRSNRYGHPSPGVLEALAARGTTVLRTDISGTVVLRTDGRSLRFVTATRTWTQLPSRTAAPAGVAPSPP